MTRSVTSAKFALLGVLLLGLAGSTDAAVPTEIVLTQNGVKHMMRDAESLVGALAAKCDKCDASTKSNAQKALVALRQAITDLENTTNRKVEDIAKTCK